MAPSKGTGGEGQKLIVKIPPEHEEELCAVTEHWDRQSREDVECPALDIFQSRMNTTVCRVLCAVCYVPALFEQAAW